MTQQIYCERCRTMTVSGRYRTLWIVVFLLLSLAITPLWLVIYLLYGLFRGKRVCMLCKHRVRPFRNNEEYRQYYMRKYPESAKWNREHDPVMIEGSEKDMKKLE